MANNTSLLDVIRHHHINNAQELTAFLSKGVYIGTLTPYPEGYGVQLWKKHLEELRSFYCRMFKKNRTKCRKNKNKRL